MLEYRTAGGFTADVESSRPELKADPEARGGPKWLPLLAEGSTADLRPAFGSSRPSGLYARAFVYSPKKQKVTAAVQTEDPVRVWVGDTSVFDRSTARTAGATTEETFAAELKEGWNVVLVKVVNAGKSHRLGLRFAGADLRTAALPDATTPTGTASDGQ